MEEILKEVDPILEHLQTLDLADADAARRSLTERFPDLGRLTELCRENLDALCPNEAGPTARFGRLAKDRHGFSVDAVLSSGPGMKHTHPAGEVDLCLAFDGAPTFDGHEPGFVVYPPGSTHPANVEGGSMFMLYFLPGGQIEWHR